MNASANAVVDAVVIGRNEGLRLQECLRSLTGALRRIVYVDSGSTDGSVDFALGLGVEVVALEPGQPFTAARARNAGLARLVADPPEFVMFVDGDCAVQPGWIPAALQAFGAHPRAVVVCGRRRERFAQASVYNAMIDREWDSPIGRADACGGDAVMRYRALVEAGGYRADLIAGEEPELCLRLRRAGGEIWRIAAEMTLHDAAISRFGQWWRRAVRAGHAFAEVSDLHRGSGDTIWRRETRRAVIWGLVLPGLALLGGAVWPPMLLILLVFPAQVLRLSRREGLAGAGLMTLGKLAEAMGVIGYWRGKLRGKRRGLIEYK